MDTVDKKKPITFNWFLSNRNLIEKAIQGGIVDCINSHGNITKQFKSSASKRIWANLTNLINNSNKLKD